ncbi:hypothetical protein TNIN_372851 [Trichonephila inaurata madagascariensis]|uniref:Uncharacterized protein n=1 Tax=Trichonephila inaurata madagascariensis TaxID=2747483 RepID=A0A8X6WUE1_9ARAC|nr:hypothetical protein TNIN_372851 [Trichonephila inaurata madagascariensis]
MIRGCFAPFISQNNVFNLTTDIRKCWTGFRATARPSDPSLTPTSQGNDTSRKVSFFTPFCSSDVRFPTLELALWCFNLHNKASDGVEEGVGHSEHTQPFTEQRKSVNPVRERPLKHC